MKNLKIFSLLAFLIYNSFIPFIIHANNDATYNIALIHSYQEGYSSGELTKELFEKELKANGIKFDIRHYYLNCELYDNREEEQRMSHIIDDISAWEGDIIGVLDDQATYSLMACNNPIVKEIPVVFSGVNYPNVEYLNQYTNITGYVDKPDYKETCKMIENIMGKVRIHVLGGDTFIDRTIWEDLQIQLKNEDIKIEYWNKTADLKKPDSTQVYNPIIDYMQVDTTSIICISADSISTKGLLWMANESFHYSLFLFTKRDFTTLRIANLFNNPGFESINEGFGVNDYMLGGYFTPLEVQMSEMAKGIKYRLEGKTPTNQFVQTPKQHVINWRTLEKYNIPISKIPDSYQIMYMPFTEKYSLFLFIIGCVVVVAIVFVIIYLFLIYRRERKRKKDALDSLQYEHENMKLAMESGKGYAWKFDGKEFYFDFAFCDMIGHSHDILEIKDILKLSHPEMKDMLKQKILTIFKNESRRGEYLLNINGEYEWWEVKYNIITNDKKTIATGIIQNIQSVKNKENELIEARKLAEKAEMKQSFLTNMSHEIRTPLNAIAGFSNLLVTEKDLTEEEKQDFAQIIDSNTNMLIKMVGDVLELSSMETGNTNFNMERQSIHELLTSIYDSNKSSIKETLEFVKEFPKDDAYIQIDKIRVSQVINNFLSNANKFTETGFIKLGYKIDRLYKKINLYVEDTGRGIAQEEQKMIFARFYKHDEFVQGVGLGLSLCQLFVEKMGGDIELSSELGKGSRFTVVFPLK